MKNVFGQDRAREILRCRLSPGNSSRRLKVASDLQKLAALCLQRLETLESTVTVSKATISPDLECATVFVSYNVNVQDKALREQVWEYLQFSSTELKKTIISKMGLKKLRDVRFKIDETPELIDELYKNLEKIKTSP